MGNNLLTILKHKFHLAFDEKWAGRPMIEPIYGEVLFDEKENVLSGRIQFHAKGRRTGKDVILLERNMPVIKNEEPLDDWIAEVLSLLLMEHQKWPK